MKTLKRLINIFNGTVNGLAVVAGVLVIFTMLSISTEVVMRYFLNRPLIWVIEISEYCLVFITFLVAAWVLRDEGHVRIDIVLNQLNLKAQVILNLVTSILGTIICFVITWYGAQVTWDHFQRAVHTATFLEIPSAPLLIIIPIGSFMLSIQFLRRTFRFAKSYNWSSDQKGL